MNIQIKRNNFLLFLILMLVLSLNFSACYIEINDHVDTNLRVLHEKSFSISPGKLFVLESSSGDVIINTWDKPEVFVKILGNRKAKKSVSFRFKGDNDKVQITTRTRRSFFNWFSSGIRLRIEIMVPANFNNKVLTRGGDINLDDINGKNILKTSGGDVNVINSKGILKVNTSGGDIYLQHNFGSFNLKTSGGDITAKNFDGDMICISSGGDIRLDGANSKISAKTSGGNIDINYSGENEGMEATTSGGDIVFKLPVNFNATVSMYTSGGDIDCRLPANNVKKMSSTKLEADLNNGGENIYARTSGGDITVTKR